MQFVKVFGLLMAPLFLTGCYHVAKIPADVSVPESVEEGVTAMSAFNFGFSPITLTAIEGEQTQLTITSDDTHTFTIDELGVNQRLSRGTNSITFTAGNAGTFDYYCAIPGHRERGMVGSVNVSSAQ